MTGGGTGGHIYPLIAVHTELQLIASANDINLRTRYVGAAGPLKGVLLKNNIEVKNILGAKLRRYFSASNLIDVPKFFIGTAQAFFRLYWFMPDVVFSKGGPGALAVVLAARFYRIPVVVHESDAVPGQTTKITSRFAKVVVLGFESAKVYLGKRGERVKVLGNPVRRDILAGFMPKKRARAMLEFDADVPLLLVLGGSQGATRLNDFLLDNLPNLLRFTQILHQTGTANYESVIREFNVIRSDLGENIANRYKAIGYFEEEIGIALSAADIVLSRAGASAIFEIAAFGKPSILVPLPEAAMNHQLKNATEYAKTGATIIVEAENLLPHLFENQLKEFLQNADKLTQMAKAASAFYRPEAASKIAELILTIKGNAR